MSTWVVVVIGVVAFLIVLFALVLAQMARLEDEDEMRIFDDEWKLKQERQRGYDESRRRK